MPKATKIQGRILQFNSALCFGFSYFVVACLGRLGSTGLTMKGAAIADLEIGAFPAIYLVFHVAMHLGSSMNCSSQKT
jgi:hypothetical protein